LPAISVQLPADNSISGTGKPSSFGRSLDFSWISSIERSYRLSCDLTPCSPEKVTNGARVSSIVHRNRKIGSALFGLETQPPATRKRVPHRRTFWWSRDVDRATAGRFLFPERDLLHTDFKRSGLYRSNRTPPRSGGLVDPKPSSDQSRLPALSFRCDAYPPKIHPLLAPQHCSRNHAGSPIRRLSPGHRRSV
jgi:hypothetical protein